MFQLCILLQLIIDYPPFMNYRFKMFCFFSHLFESCLDQNSRLKGVALQGTLNWNNVGTHSEKLTENRVSAGFFFFFAFSSYRIQKLKIR